MRTITIALLLVSTAALAQPETMKRQDRHPATAADPLPERRVTTEVIHTFEQRWEPVDQLLREQAARAVLSAPTPPAASAARTEATRPAAKVADRVRAARAPDLCERHGLRKVNTNGGRSWKCR